MMITPNKIRKLITTISDLPIKTNKAENIGTKSPNHRNIEYKARTTKFGGLLSSMACESTIGGK